MKSFEKLLAKIRSADSVTLLLAEVDHELERREFSDVQNTELDRALLTRKLELSIERSK